VVGSVGKTSTKDAIYRVLQAGGFSVRKSEKSYNSDFGVPLTILGCGSAWNDPLGWLEIMLYGLRRLLSRQPYPEWLVLEVGLEYPGEIKQIVGWVKFDLVVMTLLPEVPVHVEFFESRESIIAEKMLPALSVPSSGLVFLNADDANQLQFTPELKAKIITYGRSANADYQVSGSGEVVYSGTNTDRIPTGLGFELKHDDQIAKVFVPGVIGEHQIYPILAALALGREIGFRLGMMIDSLKDYLPPPGRLRLIAGLKDTVILDDTYNSSPAALAAALATLAELAVAGRKIAVIGDMMQLGNFTVSAHKEIGYRAAKICDLVVTVGLRAKFIDEALREKKYSAKKIKHFDDALSAGQYLQTVIKPGDVILFKASQAVRLEKAVEEIMLQPEAKAKLLARQDPEWQNR